MAWPGFPKPYPDELLYSVIARCAVHFGIQGPKSLAMTAFRNRNALAVPDLPTNLMALASTARELWSMDLNELIHAHTALPYYARLRGRQAY